MDPDEWKKAYDKAAQNTFTQMMHAVPEEHWKVNLELDFQNRRCRFRFPTDPEPMYMARFINVMCEAMLTLGYAVMYKGDGEYELRPM